METHLWRSYFLPESQCSHRMCNMRGPATVITPALVPTTASDLAIYCSPCPSQASLDTPPSAGFSSAPFSKRGPHYESLLWPQLILPLWKKKTHFFLQPFFLQPLENPALGVSQMPRAHRHIRDTLAQSSQPWLLTSPTGFFFNIKAWAHPQPAKQVSSVF